MEEARALLKEGVLAHLSALETESVRLVELQREAWRQQATREELCATVERLRAQRDQLRAKVLSATSLQQVMTEVDQENEEKRSEEEKSAGDSQLHMSLLTARLSHVKNLLRAHHLIGGYDITETRRGKGVCFSIATAFEDRTLETYNVEMDLARTMRICRHNIPPFIPLERLAQENFQSDIMAFLDSLSMHLNAYVGRRQQVRLIQELFHGSVKVLESNALCSILVLRCRQVGEKKAAALCTLEYGDPTRCLPTRVTIDSEEKTLTDSPQWNEIQALFLETPAHQALLAIRREERIA
ncbi:centromere protein O isoform X1 [Scleropages formosus]|uniref:Centromere protein O n=1 Tax=Scleropages formosus TaxID=113540 RepID=A0A8C9RK00_SCLFO|nr:centromere protein O isoform X1 [Scleropages formosus]